MMNTIQKVMTVAPVLITNSYVLLPSPPATNSPQTTHAATTPNDSRMTGNEPSQPATLPTHRVTAVLRSSGWVCAVTPSPYPPYARGKRRYPSTAWSKRTKGTRSRLRGSALHPAAVGVRTTPAGHEVVLEAELLGGDER